MIKTGKKSLQLYHKVSRFLCVPGNTSILSMVAVLLSIIIYNTSNSQFSSIANYPVIIGFGNNIFTISLQDIFSKILLSIFFLLVTLDLKHEYIAGNFNGSKSLTLTLVASLGGMVVPAIVYLIFNYGTSAHNGWVIPISTDTAFAICFLVLIKKSLSSPIYIFTIALAVFDDISSIAIMSALNYHEVHFSILIYSLIPLCILILGSRCRIHSSVFYIIVGTVLWLIFELSGVHPTLSGVIIGLFVTSTVKLNNNNCIMMIEKYNKKYCLENANLQRSIVQNSQSAHNHINYIKSLINSSITPIQFLRSNLVPLVGFIILPGFAFFNSGISLSTDILIEAILSPVSRGVFLGLLLGKPIGIVLFSYLAMKTKIGILPPGIRLYDILGAGIISGIGYTVSILASTETFKNDFHMIQIVKVSIIISAITSCFLGLIWAYGEYKGLYNTQSNI